MQSTQEEQGNEIQLVIFRLGEEEFGVDINQVLEIVPLVNITHIPTAPGFIIGVINLRGQIIPVIDVARQFNLTKSEVSPTGRIVVVEVEQNMMGMLVDEVPEVLKISQDKIEATPEIINKKISSDYIRGIGKLEERLIILLELTHLLNDDRSNEDG